MTALLLNSSYAPLTVVSARRAIVLLLSGKAEMVEPGDDEYHSERSSFVVPAVLRLLKFVKVPYRKGLPVSRKAVLARDNHECAYCDKRQATTIDHVVPRARGGKHVWENVVASCLTCNGKKGYALLFELGWTLKFQPRKPEYSMVLTMRTGQPHETWSTYLSIA